MLLPASLLAGACLAETPERAPIPSRIRVSGEAVVGAKADRVVIEVGLVSDAEQAAAAVTRNAEGVAAVLAALRSELGDGAEITTQGYSLSPRHRYLKGGGQELEGYSARSRLRVVIEDVSRAGRVIDAATGAGAGEIHDLRFELANDAPQRQQALREATRAARAKADDVAEALGLRVVRVLLLEEAGAEPSPLPRYELSMARVQGEAAVTPIEAAGIQVRARVVLEAEVGR